MLKFLTAYDLRDSKPDPHGPFVKAAAQNGWLYVISEGEGDLLRLPATTLWGEFSDADAADAAFDKAIHQASSAIGRDVILERRATSLFAHAFVCSNRQKAPIPRLVGTTLFETCLNHQLNDNFFAY